MRKCIECWSFRLLLSNNSVCDAIAVLIEVIYIRGMIIG
jgi:hypothetical protein